MFQLDVDAEFSAAHQLREYQGQCENLHGHNWKVRLSVGGEVLGSVGMLMDFGDLKRILREELERLDHVFLNETPPFDSINPTSEHLAHYLAGQIAPQLPATVRVLAVRVWESTRCAATYRP